jgi:hypothetical protein
MDKFKEGQRLVLEKTSTKDILLGMAAIKGAKATVISHDNKYVEVRWDRNGDDCGQKDGEYPPKLFKLLPMLPMDEYTKELKGVVALGRYEGTMVDFARSIRETILAEQRKAHPDQGIIKVLCDAACIIKEQMDYGWVIPRP